MPDTPSTIQTPTIPALSVFLRVTCGVKRYFPADTPTEQALRTLFPKYQTLTEEKRATLERLGTRFQDVPDTGAPNRSGRGRPREIVG